LQRSYQTLSEFTRRQERYRASGVDCFWLVRKETFVTLGKATVRVHVKRYFGGMFPAGGVGTGSLPELPVAMLDTDGRQMVVFGGLKLATVSDWLAGLLCGDYQYRDGSWNLG
jgi:competence protein CoiA